MRRVADDLQQANRSIAAMKLPGQSNTAQDLVAKEVLGMPLSMLKIFATASATGGGIGWLAGPWVGVPVTLFTAVAGALRQKGIGEIDTLVKEALLDPAMARMLLVRLKPAAIKSAMMSFAQRLRRSALAGVAAAEQPEVSGG